MLDAMRQATSGVVAKILLGLLVVSFGIWGVAGRVSSIGSEALARVGDQEVSALEFDRSLRQRIEQLSRQTGTAVTLEQANAIGISQQVLGELLSNAALDDRAADYNLGVSDDKLASRIVEDPAFKGPDGRFDRDRFRALLQNAGLREDNYVRTFRRSIARQQLAEAVAGGVKTPQPMVEAYYRYQNEERTLSGVTVDASAIEPVGEPTDTELQAYFDENVASFRAPEYRKLGVIVLDPAAMSDAAAVTDEEVAAEFEQRKSDFTVPERRQVEEIRFDTAEDLAEAKRQAESGTAFAAIAEARGKSPADIDLGLKTKAEIIDQAVADAAFGAAENDVVAVPDGMLGPALIRVASIEPGGTKALAEVSDRLRSDLATRRADDRIVELYNAIEDERAAGGTLEEVAQKVGVPHRTIAAVAEDGSVPAGEPAYDLPAGDAVLADAFQSDVGVENDPIRSGDGGYVFYEVTEVIPARDRSLEEARDAVVAAWRESETADRIAAKADEMFQRLKAGASMEEIATAIGKPVARAENVKRGSQPPAGLSRNAVVQAFAGPEGHIANAEADTPPARILVKVQGVTAPAYFAESESARAVDGQLSTALGRDLLATYNSQLLQSAKTSINSAIYAQLTGSSRDR